MATAGPRLLWIAVDLPSRPPALPPSRPPGLLPSRHIHPSALDSHPSLSATLSSCQVGHPVSMPGLRSATLRVAGGGGAATASGRAGAGRSSHSPRDGALDGGRLGLSTVAAHGAAHVGALPATVDGGATTRRVVSATASERSGGGGGGGGGAGVAAAASARGLSAGCSPDAAVGCMPNPAVVVMSHNRPEMTRRWHSMALDGPRWHSMALDDTR